MSFKVGDRVLCIESGENIFGNYKVVQGQEYTIEKGSFIPYYSNFECVMVSGQNVHWSADRFVKPKTSQRKTNSVTRKIVKDFEELKEYDPQEIPKPLRDPALSFYKLGVCLKVLKSKGES